MIGFGFRRLFARGEVGRSTGIQLCPGLESFQPNRQRAAVLPRCSLLLTSGSRILTSGSRILTSGSRMLISGSRILTRGSRVLTRGSRVLTRGSRILTSGSHRLTSGSHRLTSGSHRLTSGSRILTMSSCSGDSLLHIDVVLGSHYSQFWPVGDFLFSEPARRVNLSGASVNAPSVAMTGSYIVIVRTVPI